MVSSEPVLADAYPSVTFAIVQALDVLAGVCGNCNFIFKQKWVPLLVLIGNIPDYTRRSLTKTISSHALGIPAAAVKYFDGHS